MNRLIGFIKVFKSQQVTQDDIIKFSVSVIRSSIVDYDYSETLRKKGWKLSETLDSFIDTMNEQEIGTCLTAIVECERVDEFLSNGIILKLLGKLWKMVPDYFYSPEPPKYVVVRCSHFGTGIPGWRLSEVDFYCFAKDYPTAKKIKGSWEGYGKLTFTIKYENWINKGGEDYNDGLPFDTKRYRRYI